MVESYGNFKDRVKNNPNINPFYFCSNCGIWNDPFTYNNAEFENQKKLNICPKCKEVMKKKDLYEKTTQ